MKTKHLLLISLLLAISGCSTIVQLGPHRMYINVPSWQIPPFASELRYIQNMPYDLKTCNCQHKAELYARILSVNGYRAIAFREPGGYHYRVRYWHAGINEWVEIEPKYGTVAIRSYHTIADCLYKAYGN